MATSISISNRLKIYNNLFKEKSLDTVSDTQNPNYMPVVGGAYKQTVTAFSTSKYTVTLSRHRQCSYLHVIDWATEDGHQLRHQSSHGLDCWISAPMLYVKVQLREGDTYNPREARGVSRGDSRGRSCVSYQRSDTRYNRQSPTPRPSVKDRLHPRLISYRSHPY